MASRQKDRRTTKITSVRWGSKRWIIVYGLLLGFTLMFVTFSSTWANEALAELDHIEESLLLELHKEESIQELRERLPPSIWSQAGGNSDPDVTQFVNSQLTPQEKEKATSLCGKFLYSSITRAVSVGDMGEQTFVATGDIDDMWTRDSAVQIGLYVSRMREQPFLRPIIEGAIRRQAFNTIQDPYANAFELKWVNPSSLPLKDRVIGRGGWVATRNYELDSGAYYMTQLYDYYVTEGLYRPEALLQEPSIFDAAMLMVDTWIVEQRHDQKSPYRYFELAEGGKGMPTAYTGMTWSGFRPSDDACQYHYLVPSNIYAAAALERILVLNDRVWKSDDLKEKATKLLREIEEGIRQHGVVQTDTGVSVYAYEVDGKGNKLVDFDDANIPSLLSIPLLGWTGYDRQIYNNTRARLLSSQTNKYYFSGKVLRGIGSPHTPGRNVWPLAMAIEALTQEGTREEVIQSFVFQLRQSLQSACNDAMHESVNSDRGCPSLTRQWFEWANALFVVLVETSMGLRCDSHGIQWAQDSIRSSQDQTTKFYKNAFKNDHGDSKFFQGIGAMVPHHD